MIAVNAYFDGNNYVLEDNVLVKQNQKVIITLLDEFVPKKQNKTLEEIRSYMKGGKSVPDGISTVDYIRQLRAD